MPRVVTFDDFCALPDGVVYSHFRPCVVDGLYRRGVVHRIAFDNLPYRKRGDPTDFYELDLLASPGQDTCDGEGPFDPPADSWCRWGCHEYNAQFLVYDEADVKALIAGLTRSCEGAPL